MSRAFTSPHPRFSASASPCFLTAMGVPLYRDIEHQTKEYLLSTPVSAGAYFWGRFWGSFAVLVLISLGALAGYVLGSWLGPAFDWSKPERFGPNVPIHYFWPFLTIFLPSLFFTSCLFFGLVALTRNNRVLYSASILLFILYLYLFSAPPKARALLLMPAIVNPNGYACLSLKRSILKLCI